ncbi:MAG: hypothetical protein JXR10_06995 [Cyclobacteriaceae bacterium]
MKQKYNRLSFNTDFLSFGLLIPLNLETQAQTFVRHKLIKPNPEISESYQSMTFQGAWCWFLNPLAVYFEGAFRRTYSVWVDNYGDIHGEYYDQETKKFRSKVIYNNQEIDDHNNPSILIDEVGKLLVFLTRTPLAGSHFV